MILLILEGFETFCVRVDSAEAACTTHTRGVLLSRTRHALIVEVYFVVYGLRVGLVRQLLQVTASTEQRILKSTLLVSVCSRLPWPNR